MPEGKFSYLDLLYIGASWACWRIAGKHKIRDDLNEVFPKDGDDLLRLAIYSYLTHEGISGYNTWLSNRWLPEAKPLTSRRISEILEKVNSEKIKEYYRKRFDRCVQDNERDAGNELLGGKTFLALDSTSISSYSQTLDDAAYGNARHSPESKQINLVLVINYRTGDPCYAFALETSISSKAPYSTLLHDLEENGFDLTQLLLATDRGFESHRNLQDLLQSGVGYVSGVPLSEKDMKGKFIRYKDSSLDLVFWSEKLDVSALTLGKNSLFRL